MFQAISRIENYGREEGYPDCCIAAFVLDVALGVAPAEQRPLGADGRVMCPKCAASPIMRRKTLEQQVRDFERVRQACLIA